MIRELIAAYAHCADRREAEQQKALFTADTHFLVYMTVGLDGERATGEVYCVAHHVFSADDGRKIMLAYLRHIDTYVKQSGAWLFAQPLSRIQ